MATVAELVGAASALVAWIVVLTHQERTRSLAASGDVVSVVSDEAVICPVVFILVRSDLVSNNSFRIDSRPNKFVNKLFNVLPVL